MSIIKLAACIAKQGQTLIITPFFRVFLQMPGWSPTSSERRPKQGPLQTVADFALDIDEAFVKAYGNEKSEYCGYTQEAINLRDFRRGLKKEWLVEGVHMAIREAMFDFLPYDIDDVEYWKDVIDAAEDAESIVMLNRRKKKNYVAFERHGFTRVYVDGACIRNGRPDAQGGIGVWFGHDHKWYSTSISLLWSS